MCLQASVQLVTLKPRGKRSSVITPAFACSRSPARRSPSEVRPGRGEGPCVGSPLPEPSCSRLGPLTAPGPAAEADLGGHCAPSQAPAPCRPSSLGHPGARDPGGSSGHPDRAGLGDCDPRWPPRRHPCDARRCQCTTGSSLQPTAAGSRSRADSHVLTDAC